MKNEAVEITFYRPPLKAIIFVIVLAGGFILIKPEPALPRIVTQSKSVGTFRGQNYSRQEVEALIRESARKYGLPVDKVLRIARCESKLDHTAISKNGTYWGVYQFNIRMWNNMPEGKARIDRRDAVVNINAAHRYMKAHGYSAWGCK